MTVVCVCGSMTARWNVFQYYSKHHSVGRGSLGFGGSAASFFSALLKEYCTSKQTYKGSKYFTNKETLYCLIAFIWYLSFGFNMSWFNTSLSPDSLVWCWGLTSAWAFQNSASFTLFTSQFTTNTSGRQRMFRVCTCTHTNTRHTHTHTHLGDHN